jgi:hypothetical protein
MVVKLAGPVFFSPIFLVPGVLVAVLGIYLANIYLKAQMSVKREMRYARVLFRLFLSTDDVTLAMLVHQYWPTLALRLPGSVGSV